ncbi:regulator of G protein signaling superfamily [Periconia macrospinosa]|uniref:Regulator of G protein signaling superfamily n=1 Tax=Periconia macrospinosa TaxID=97972 RepID=A0A2V1DPV9_9PLEO|nr:regulator of G protein signaling superfamily [Periconia macrospinosa]
MQRPESCKQTRGLRIFQQLCRQKYFNKLPHFRLRSRRRNIPIAVPVEPDLHADRYSRNSPRQDGLVAGLPRASMGNIDCDAPKFTELSIIIQNPKLSSLFGNFLKSTHCWENFAFYLEVTDFLDYYELIEHTSMWPNNSHDALAKLHQLYDTFIARSAPWEVNIDPSLRSLLATLLKHVMEKPNELSISLADAVSLTRQARSAVFELMANDSVPKFVNHPAYAVSFREYGLRS